MAVTLTPSEIAAKQAARLKSSLDEIRQGVNRVEVAPGKQAAAQADKWQAAMSSQRTLDKWRENVGSVSLEDWKASMINKGVDRIPAGIDAAQPKMIAYYEKAIPHINSGQVQLDRMPNLTLEDSISRATFWIRHMAQMDV